MNLQNIAVLVNIIHHIFTYLTIFGFMLPKKYLKFHALIFPLTYLHWKTNDGCILTQMEKYLKGNDSDSLFMKSFFESWGINLTMRNASIWGIILFTLSWVITMYRLLF